MISIEHYEKPSENLQVVKLVYYSMRNKYTSVSNPDGLSFKEVRSIISRQPVTVIKDGDKIVGIVNFNEVGFSLHRQLGLADGFTYHNIGMIYIDKKERGNGYAGQVLQHFINTHKNLIYIAHTSNKPSNKVASKYLNFFKQHSAFRSFEPYNVYKIEQ